MSKKRVEVQGVGPNHINLSDMTVQNPHLNHGSHREHGVSRRKTRFRMSKFCGHVLITNIGGYLLPVLAR